MHLDYQLFLPCLILFIGSVSTITNNLPADIEGGTETVVEQGDTNDSFYHGFLASLSVIAVSEIGDKTWFIAVILSMRYSRLCVFAGAMVANALMTILSGCLGWLTQLIPQIVTFWLSKVLLILFGLKMLLEAGKMSPDEAQEEFEEAKEEVEKRERDLNVRKIRNKKSDNKSGDRDDSTASIISSTRVLFEAFTLTFLGEWGDRSQVTTIILSARENIAAIMSGGILGHAICTGIAVLGGKLIAHRISARIITLVGGILFLIFAFY